MRSVPNERLRVALQAAGLTYEQVSARIGVNPKTVQRWVREEQRQPHGETRRQLATLLKVDAGHLWPHGGRKRLPVESGPNELIHVYPTRSSIPVAVWGELIRGAETQVDVLVFSGQFLIEQFDFMPIIRAKAAEGVRFRLAVGDHTAPAVIQRAAEEGTTGGLEGRVQMMRRYLQDVVDLPGMEIRTHGTILYNSIYRFDDQALVNPHVFGSLAGQNPVLHLQRVPGSVMWETYMRSFERAWSIAVPEPAAGA